MFGIVYGECPHLFAAEPKKRVQPATFPQKAKNLFTKKEK